ncbi:DUF1573 domain-containing protein [bacterium]|nr:DUF1573 domain-containing protein [candidate division CSSED10-310 bacterium]
MASAKEIPPGGEGKIDVSFKTERRKGVNRKQITITTNDPESPRIQIEVIADLEELLAASPNRQWFGQMKQDETVTRPFVFEGKLLGEAQLSNIRIKEDSPNRNAYTWKLKDTTTGETRELSLDVTVDATKIQPGRFTDIMLITTNLEKSPEIQLNLSGEVMGPIAATPQRLYFGQFEVNKEMEKTITLTSNTGQPFKIINASIDEKEFKIDPWKRDAAIEHTLKIRLFTDVPTDRIRTSLNITTDMGAQPNVQVEIHAYQQRSRPEQAKTDPSTMQKEPPKTNASAMRKELLNPRSQMSSSKAAASIDTEKNKRKKTD